MHTFTETDEGKRVVNASGDKIGVVSGVRNDNVYVDADPSISDRIRATLGWEHVDEDDYVLDQDKINTVTEDEIRLKRDM
ncbi:hypothetical protein L593_07340 [Salinarchaeum sp. Harcht-Bsk1]|nr:hypothetical protein L593_07340 [Salinarchaeum sp. Harcht-Bsk1]